MSKFKVGDLVKFKDKRCVSIEPARERYPEPFRVTGFDGCDRPLFEDAYWWNGTKWAYNEDCFELIEEKEMSKFKVGDRVRAIAESNGWGKVKKGDIGVITHITDTHLRIDFPEQKAWHGEHRCFELVEESPINTKDMYSNIMGQGIVCGDTEIRAAKRRRKGEQQYVISYTNSKLQNGVVKHSDIPALVAALLDIYDGDVKEEEAPF